MIDENFVDDKPCSADADVKLEDEEFSCQCKTGYVDFVTAFAELTPLPIPGQYCSSCPNKKLRELLEFSGTC